MFLSLGLFAACGDDGGSNNGDDAPPIDAAVDAPPAPAMITITGTVVSRGLATTPVPNATIAGYRNSDENTPVAMTTSNAQGMYTLVIMTGGVALDGYLKASAPNLLDSYLYPPAAVAADTNAPMNMVSESILNILVSRGGGGSTQPGAAQVALIVVDGPNAQSNPVAGAVVDSTPAAGKIAYSGTDGLPDGTTTMTAMDGLAYLINTPAGSLTVRATKTGSTFKSHGLKARGDVLTTTLITP